jgi:hypothetical protein
LSGFSPVFHFSWLGIVSEKNIAVIVIVISPAQV